MKNKVMYMIISVVVALLFISVVFVLINNKMWNKESNDFITNNILNNSSTDESKNMNSIEVITAEEAKLLMDKKTDYTLLDVRTKEEYDQGHINGSILISYDQINIDSISNIVPNKDSLILVYCRSGNRSGKAAKILEQLGYTNIKDFGGIIDWKYEIVK